MQLLNCTKIVSTDFFGRNVIINILTTNGITRMQFVTLQVHVRELWCIPYAWVIYNAKYIASKCSLSLSLSFSLSFSFINMEFECN